MCIERCSVRDKKCIDRFIDIVMEGGVVVFPTDTVYGLGGDPFNINTVNRITHLKGRKHTPYPILVGDAADVLKLFSEENEVLSRMTSFFWPGALTIIYRSKIRIPANFFQDKIGLRMPRNDALLSVIKSVGGYLVGTSANISGYPSAFNISMAIDYFGDGVDLYVDGGELDYRSSTIIEVIDKKIFIKRVGVVSRSDLELFCDLNRCVVV